MDQQGHLYADLSSYYDLFCTGVDYEEQSAFAHRVFSCFAETDSRRCLDLACGTGPHIAGMMKYGYQCTGLDNSAQMLDLARLRCPDATYIHSDMAALDMDSALDMVSCFLYSIHYNNPLSNLQQTLARVFRALVPGGVFLFNTVDVRGINSRHFVNTEARHQGHLLRFCSGWRYAGQGDVMDLHLTVADTFQGSTRQWQDVHHMSAFTVTQLKQWLQDCGFEVTLLEHDYSRLQPWDGASFNLLVVASKPALG